MAEALIAIAFLVFSAIVGRLLKPNEDQLRPLTPEASSGDSSQDHHH